jgi:hypothetical protein
MSDGVRAFSLRRVGGTDAVAGIVVFQAGVGGLELGLYGIPLLLYPSVRASATLRKREEGTRPDYNTFFCASSLLLLSECHNPIGSVDWLPNHVLIMVIVVVFTILNPLIIPFAWIYFCVANGLCFTYLYGQGWTS